MVHVRVLLVHHVQVGLKDGEGRSLVTCRTGLADDHVSGGIGFVFESIPLRHADHVLAHLLLFLGAAGNGEDLVEVAPQGLRLECRDEGHAPSW